MLEEGEIDEEVTQASPAARANEAKKHSPPNDDGRHHHASGKRKNTSEHFAKRSKLVDDPSWSDDEHQPQHQGRYNGFKDRDDRQPPVRTNVAQAANSLMSIPMSEFKLVSKTLKETEADSGSSSGWLSPPKRDAAVKEPPATDSKRSGPPSIFDLITTSTLQAPSASAGSEKLINFLNFDSSQMQSAKSSFVDPVITEKENKPKARHQASSSGADHSKRGKFGKHGGFSAQSGTGPSFEISDKKAEKKRKYFDEHRGKEDGAKFTPREREPIVCKFYLEGRCQKGDECPFSHNAQLNKRLEVCKYYLNGFCAKKDQCLYMHSDFPCKFYHRVNRETGQRRNECLHGSQCRFSHEPIKNPMLKEAFEKYLAECDESKASGAGASSSGKYSEHNAPAVPSNIPSLMALPLASAPVPPRPSLASPSHPSSPPPLQAPLPLLATSIMSLDRTPKFQDIDERDAQTKPATGDIDERALPTVVPVVPVLANLNSILATVASVKESASSYSADKEKLLGLVMKAIADDGSVFSQIPKQTLSELLLKLLQNKPESQLSHETIKTLLATFTSATQPGKNSVVPSNKPENGLLRRKSTYSDYDDEEDEDDGQLVIEGNVGEIPYRIYEIDVEPSSLWSHPPSSSMASLLAQSMGDEAIDQESDPRIKYYANKSNLMNVANFHKQVAAMNQQQQQQVTAPGSPNAQTTAQSQSPSSSSGLSDLVLAKQQQVQAKTPATAPTATGVRIDPRLARSINSTPAASASPTRSVSPPQPNGTLDLHETLQSLNGNTLLGSLPDFQLPAGKDPRVPPAQASLSSLFAPQQATTTHSDSSTVKLSIEDYKRKLQKPGGTNGSSTGLNSLNSIINTASAQSANNLASLTASMAPTATPSSSSPTIPGMPSMYSVNLQAPQSLHELLRNFQS